MKKWISSIAVLYPILTTSLLASEESRFGDPYSKKTLSVCEQKEQKKKLLTQQISESKVCKSSKISKGATDCEFKADKTTILLVGAMGASPAARNTGMGGMGFYIESVDPKHNVRTFTSDKGAVFVRIDRKDNLDKDKGCLYDEVQINVEGRSGIPNDFL